MTQFAKDYANLLLDFQDNTTKQINPQHSRNIIESVAPKYFSVRSTEAGVNISGVQGSGRFITKDGIRNQGGSYAADFKMSGFKTAEDGASLLELVSPDNAPLLVSLGVNVELGGLNGIGNIYINMNVIQRHTGGGESLFLNFQDNLGVGGTATRVIFAGSITRALRAGSRLAFEVFTGAGGSAGNTAVSMLSNISVVARGPFRDYTGKYEGPANGLPAAPLGG